MSMSMSRSLIIHQSEENKIRVPKVKANVFHSQISDMVPSLTRNLGHLHELLEEVRGLTAKILKINFVRDPIPNDVKKKSKNMKKKKKETEENPRRQCPCPAVKVENTEVKGSTTDQDSYFVITFLNQREKDFLPEATVKYFFAKFGPISDIKYNENGLVSISYNEEKCALDALETINMGSKYRASYSHSKQTEKKIKDEIVASNVKDFPKPTTAKNPRELSLVFSSFENTIYFGKAPLSSQPLEIEHTIPNIFDSHCHLDRMFSKIIGKNFSNSKYKINGLECKNPLDILKHEFKSKFPASFEGLINVITNPTYFDIKYWEWIVANEPNIYLALGCHPSSVSAYDEVAESELERALKHPKVVAIGEFGLDDGWCNDSKNEFANQERVFRRQIKLALKTEKPMVLHLRGPNSLAVAKEVLESMVPKNWPIHMHGFTNSWKICQPWAKDWPNMKFGLISDKFDPEIIRNLPMNRILLETDAPYFLPLRLRNNGQEKINISFPSDVWYVANQIAYYKEVKVKEILQANRENVSELYKIPPWESKYLPPLILDDTLLPSESLMKKQELGKENNYREKLIKKQDELENSYAEHGQDFISYHEKEGALKALEIVNMGSKYHVETEWQPVKKTS